MASNVGGAISKDQHAELLINLDNDFLPKYLEQFKVMLNGHTDIGKGKIEKCENFLALLELMEERGHLGVGRYGKLRTILEKTNLVYLLKIVPEIKDGESSDMFLTLQRELKQYHIKKSKVPYTPWPRDKRMHELKNMYIDMACKKEEHGTEFTLSYEELFKEENRILLLGDAGLGKTTFTKKLAFDWANKSDETLDMFKLVFVISLRSVTKDQSLVDVIYDQLLPRNTEVSESDLRGILDKEGTLLIFDGYDEFNTSTSREITDIIEWRSFRQCYVLVTSRHRQGTEIKENHSCFTLTGFSKQNIDLYATKTFGPTANEFIDFLKQGGVSDTLAKIPFILVMLCVIYEECPLGHRGIADPMYSGIVGVYKLLHIVLLKKYNNRQIKQKQGKELMRPEEVFDHFREFLHHLGKAAFSRLFEHNGIVFEDQNTDRLLMEKAEDVGLLCRQELYRGTCPVTQWTFVHHSLGEFVSALYIGEAAEDKHMENFTAILNNMSSRNYYIHITTVKKYYLMLLFCAGLCETGHVVQRVLHHLVDIANILWDINPYGPSEFYKGLLQLLVDILEEIGTNHRFPVLVKEELNRLKQLVLWGSKARRGLHALKGYSWSGLHSLSLYDVSPDTMQALCVKDLLCRLNWLELSNIHLAEREIPSDMVGDNLLELDGLRLLNVSLDIMQAVCTKNVLEQLGQLQLVNIQLTEKAVPVTFTDNSSFCRLHALLLDNVSHNILELLCVRRILDQLEYLSLINIHVTEEVLSEFRETNCPKISYLKLGNVSIGLLQVLCTSTVFDHLQLLNLYDIRLTEEEIPSSMTGDCLPKIWVLSLQDVSFPMVRRLCVQPLLSQLSGLCLLSVHLDITVLHELSVGISKNSKLEELDLNKCSGLRNDGSVSVRHTLLEAICRLPNLKQLNLSECALGDDDLQLIQNSLLVQSAGKRLETLVLGRNKFSQFSMQEARRAFKNAMPDTFIYM